MKARSGMNGAELPSLAKFGKRDPAATTWPTPVARDHMPPHSPAYIAEKRAQGHGMANLNDVVAHGHLGLWAGRLWPTPTAKEFRTMDREKLIARRERCREKHKNGNGFGLTLGNALTLAGETDGELNPAWVEWLMGFPAGWTE